MSLRWILCITTLVAALPAFAAPPFHFNYRVEGAEAALPTVVYNDGHRTYIRLPGKLAPKGAFVGGAGTFRFMTLKHEPPYYVVPAVAKRIRLVTSQGPVTLIDRDAVAHPMIARDTRQLKKLNRELADAKSALANIAPRAESAQPVDQRPTPAQTATGESITSSQVAASSGASNQPPVASAPRETAGLYRPSHTSLANGSATWRVNAGGTLRETLGRWAARAGWHLVWPGNDTDWTMAGSAVYRGSFVTAARAYLTALHAQGLPVRGKFWRGNHTLQILGVSDD
jgi:hypothetical protein